MKRQKHRNFPVVVQEKPCLGQAEIRSQKFQCGPPCGYMEPKQLYHLLPSQACSQEAG